MDFLPTAGLNSGQVKVLPLFSHQETAFHEFEAESIVFQARCRASGSIGGGGVFFYVVFSDGLGQEVPVEPVDPLSESQLYFLKISYN